MLRHYIGFAVELVVCFDHLKVGIFLIIVLITLNEIEVQCEEEKIEGEEIDRLKKTASHKTDFDFVTAK